MVEDDEFGTIPVEEIIVEAAVTVMIDLRALAPEYLGDSQRACGDDLIALGYNEVGDDRPAARKTEDIRTRTAGCLLYTSPSPRD